MSDETPIPRFRRCWVHWHPMENQPREFWWLPHLPPLHDRGWEEIIILDYKNFAQLQGYSELAFKSKGRILDEVERIALATLTAVDAEKFVRVMREVMTTAAPRRPDNRKNRAR